MTVNCSWSGKHEPKIRVSLTVAPGELHPKLLEPAAVEAWLKVLLEGHGKQEATK